MCPKLGQTFGCLVVEQGAEASCDRRLVDRVECQMMDGALSGGEAAVR